MYVCLCIGISDREILETVREGACTVEEVMYCTGAGTHCGNCVPTIEEIVTEHAPDDAEAKSGRRCLTVVRVVTSAA
jgi:bacterioferritin-associated ferredoxin